jgi:hypothetical protein
VAVDWYYNLFMTIDMRSFSSLWYWIGLAVMWSSASHWVLGVPNDVIQRARRVGGQAEEDLAVLLRINISRLLYIAQVSGVWLLALTFFVLTALAMLGFYYGIEFAQAVFLLTAPMAIVGAMTIATARRLAAEGVAPPRVYRRLTAHRLSVQVLGVVAIFITSMWGMWHNMHVNVLGY